MPTGRHQGRIAFNHVGLCVTDLARSRRFYEEALGFSYWWELEAPDEAVGTLLQVRLPAGLRAVYLLRDGLVLELLAFQAGEHPQARRRAVDEPGLTHLSLAVEDLSQACQRVAELGGQVVEGAELGLAVMVRDPDGQLIELTSWDWQASLPPRPDPG